MLAFVCLPASTAIAEDGFTSIFDGKTLKGWDGDPNFWTVKDGAITGQTTKDRPTKGNTFVIWTGGKPGDFELKLQYRIIPNNDKGFANSGIQYRSFKLKKGADRWRIGGYQADFEAGTTYSGILYGEQFRGILSLRGNKTELTRKNGKLVKKVVGKVGDSAAIQKKIKKNDWNDYHIIAKGFHFVHKINGVVTAECIDNDKKMRRDSGLLALQLHQGQPMTVQFRKIRIKQHGKTVSAPPKGTLDEGPGKKILKDKNLKEPGKPKPPGDPLLDDEARKAESRSAKGKKKIVLIAGKKSHGYGAHEHRAGCMLLAKALNESGLPVNAVVVTEGWPKDTSVLNGAASIVIYADGGGRHPFNAHIAEIDKLMKKGVGMVCIHYGVEVPKGKSGDAFLDWTGGYFEAHWSVNPHWTAKYRKLPKHAITRGVKPFRIHDEWYYHMRFRDKLQGVTPILTDLPPRSTLVKPDGSLARPNNAHNNNPHARQAVLERKEPQHMAWATERKDGGRGFGFTGGHDHWNWGHDQFRKLMLNAIAWTAHVEVPKNGVPSKRLTVKDLMKNQDYKPRPNFNPLRIQKMIDEWNSVKTSEPHCPRRRRSDAPITQQNLDGMRLVLGCACGNLYDNQIDPKAGISFPAKRADMNASLRFGLFSLFLLAATADAAEPKPRFDSKLITTRTPGNSVEIDVDISGAKKLYLVVTDGGNGFGCDWADWAEPRLLGKSNGRLKLTTLKWSSATTGWGKVGLNRNVEGGPLKIDGKSVEYGIGTHANSVIEYDIPAGYTRFLAKAGLDDGGASQQGGSASSVRFLVYTERPPATVLARRGESSVVSGSRSLKDAVSNLDYPKDLEVKLFAGEPVMKSPSNIDVDHLGRVWVCEIVNYRHFRNRGNPERKAGDRILILKDTDGDGQADKTTVFYQGRDIDSAHGICVLGNRVIVSAGDKVFVMTDTNGDGKSDKKDVLFTGISGTQHDHGIHAFTFGPDGKLYFNFGNAGKQIKDKHGKPIVDKAGNTVNDSRKPYQEGMVFRCNLDGSELETLGWNFRNNWEVAVDSFGTLWQSDNDDDGNRGVRINFVMEFGNYGYKDELTGAGWRAPRTGMHQEIPKRHWHLRDPGVMPNLLQTGAGSPTGICVYEGSLLPQRFRNQLMHCDAGPNVVRSYAVTSDGAGYSAKTNPILTGTRDKWFRPSDVCVAPDGSLIVADWYDPGVGGHRMGDVTRGRIFRVAPSKSPYKVPKYDFKTSKGLIEALASPNLAARYLAWQGLHDLGAQAEEPLKNVFATSKNPRLRARALWLLGKIEVCGEHYVKRALADGDENIRIVALRLARQTNLDVVSIVEQLVSDPSAAVRRECAVALRGSKAKELPKLWAALANRHDGKDRWYLEALGIAARHRWDECLGMYLAQQQSIWSTPGGRDIVWRARSAQALPLLGKLITDERTTSDERLRYFRAFDFHQPKAKDVAALKSKVLIKLATGSHKDQATITALALKHHGAVDLNSSPELKAAVNRALDAAKGTPQFISLVSQFSFTDRYPELLAIAQRHPDEQLGVEAIRALLAKKQFRLIRGALTAGKKTPEELKIATIRALGNSGDGRANGILRSILDDRNMPVAIRREAARSFAKSRNGALDLVKRAGSRKLDSRLKQAVAAALHAAQWRDVKEQANKLFPLPPSKNSKPLPPIAELLKRKGNVVRGRVVFNTVGTCSKCHKLNEFGKDVGPDLSEIGKKLSRRAMFESVLYPSAGISHNYESYNIALLSGNTVAGLITSRTADSLTIKGADAISRTFKTSEIDEIQKQDVSLMPADLQKLMTVDELVELQPVFFRGRFGPFDQSIAVNSRRRPKVYGADRLRRRDIDCAGVVVDADIPAHTGGIELVVLPPRVGFGFVVNTLHFDEKRNHGQIGVHTFTCARMSRPAAGRRDKSVSPLVGVDHFQHRRLADNASRFAGDHLGKQFRPFSDLFRAAVTNFLVRRAEGTAMKRIRRIQPALPAGKRQGAMLIFIAVLLFVFLGIVAFSVDVAYMHLARTQLRTSADAAARAAGETLSRTQNLTLARQAAKDVAELNLVDGSPLYLEDDDIINGNSEKQSSGRWTFTAGATPVNGFRVTGRKMNDAPSGAVGLYFAKLFGEEYYELSATSASVRMDRDICIVVDRSSSMKLYLTDTQNGMYINDWRVCANAQPKSRWVALQGAVDVFLEELDKTTHREYVGLASYASDFNYCNVNNQQSTIDRQLDEDTSLVSSAMNTITNSVFNGNTAIGEGLRRGNDVLTNQTYGREFARKTMVLMTDGNHNNGVSPITAANEAKALGIVIYTITFSDGASQSDMQQVASITGGKHYHAPDEEALVAAFREIALSLSVIITE
eukprot:g26570.t1